MDKTVNELKNLEKIFCSSVKDLKKNFTLFSGLKQANEATVFSPVINAEVIKISVWIGYFDAMREHIISQNPTFDQFKAGFIDPNYDSLSDEDKLKACLDVFEQAFHRICTAGSGIVNTMIMNHRMNSHAEPPKFIDFPAGEVHAGRIFKQIYLGEMERVDVLTKMQNQSLKPESKSEYPATKEESVKKEDDVPIYIDALIAIKKNTDGTFIASGISEGLADIITENSGINRIAMTIYSKEDHKVQIESVIKNGLGDPFMGKRFQTRFIDIKDFDESKKSANYFVVSNNAMIEKSMRKAYGIE